MTTGVRFTVSGSAGSRDGKQYAVIDKHGNARVSWHRTIAQAMAQAKRLNNAAARSAAGAERGTIDKGEDCP